MFARRRAVSTVYASALFALVEYSASLAADGDWPTYNRTLAGDRFSPLKEINPSNVAQLKPVCAYTLSEASSLKTGPLVVRAGGR